MVSVPSHPESRTGEHERFESKLRRVRSLERIVHTWTERAAPLPVAVVLSIFDDLLQDADGQGFVSDESSNELSLAHVHIDEHGVASLRERSASVSQLSLLLAEVLGATGEHSIPLAVRGLLRSAQGVQPPLDAEWFRAELRRTLGPPGPRAEVRVLVEAVEPKREVVSLIPAEAMLDSTRPEEALAHATFIDPTRPEEPVEESLLERMSEPPMPAPAPETFDLEPVAEPEQNELRAPVEPEELLPEPLDDDIPTERPSPASALPGASNWADSIQSSRPAGDARSDLDLDLEPKTELIAAQLPGAAASDDLSESAFEVEAQTAFPSEAEPKSEPRKSDDPRPKIRLEQARPRPVSLTYAPAARLRGSAPPDEVPSRIRIPAEERGRAWAILVFSLVVGLVAAWALGYLP